MFLFILFGFFVVIRGEERTTRVDTVESHDKVVVCYWGTWANYRPDSGKFTPEQVDGSLCTHLIYSFAGLDTKEHSIKSLDPWMDLQENYGLGGFQKAADIKYAHPHLKVSIAIGGWNEGSKKYSEMAENEEKRAKFVSSAVQFLKKHNFDGLDLDWEYPGKRGGKPQDKTNFILLIQELYVAFRNHGFLLTAAIGASPSTIDRAYDVPSLYKYLDYVHVMCYDYHGKWDRKTGHNAPLYARPEESGGDATLNVNYTMEYLKRRGANPAKTVLGVPFYGRAFTLINPHDHDMSAKSKATSFQGPYTREDGFMGYNEICEEQMNEENPWTSVWDEYHKAPYMYKDQKWVSYDNEESIKIKSQYAFDQGLAGVMIWSIDTDDFRGNCRKGIRYPLLRVINKALHHRTIGAGSSSLSSPAFLCVILILAASIFPHIFQR